MTASRISRDTRAPSTHPSGSSSSLGSQEGSVSARSELHRRSTSIPPKLAPAVVPRMDGLASGFRNKPWTSTPPMAKAAPASMLLKRRHVRNWKNVSRSLWSARLPSPTKSDAAPAEIRASTRSIHVCVFRFTELVRYPTRGCGSNQATERVHCMEVQMVCAFGP